MKSPQIFLRAIEPEDLDALSKIENDPELWGVSTTNVPYSRFALHAYVESCTNDIYTDKQVRLMIENECHETVGIIDLTSFSPQNSRAEVGIVIMKPHRRQGYASAALVELISYARKILHLHQLYLVTSERNVPCLQLFAQQGFRQTATLHDWFLSGDKHENACFMQLFL